MNDPADRDYHDGGALSPEEAARLCSGREPWFHIHAPDGTLIGVIALLRSNGVQAELCIHLAAPWRGRGIGKEALERMKAAAFFGMGIRELYVRVLPSNHRALCFFGGCGFSAGSDLPAHLQIPGARDCRILKCTPEPKTVSLSVVIPMHDSARWLRRCVASIGDFPCEILLIDDASADDTCEIAQALAEQDNRIRVLLLAEHGMAGAARNAGLRCASGEYVLFLDSDDAVTDPEMLRRMAQYATVSGTDCVVTTRYEACRGVASWSVRRWGEYSGLVTSELRPGLYGRQFPIWMAWYRRSFLESHGLFFPEKVSYEDNYFSFRLVSEVESICTVPGTMIRHFLREDSLAAVPDLKVQTSFFEVTDLCLHYVRARKLDRLYPREITHWYIHGMFFTAVHVWRTMFPKEGWIVREAVDRLHRNFPALWENGVQELLSPEEYGLLKQAWQDPDGFLAGERV